MYGQIVIENRLPFGRKPGPSSLSLPDLIRQSIWRHPKGVTRGSIFQSTILTMENNGATRSLWHNAVNLPRACRAGHPRAFYFFMSSPGIVPGIHISKHNLDHGKQWSNAVSVAQCYQLAARLPCRWILGSSPRMT